jgi:hypothetical protein
MKPETGATASGEHSRMRDVRPPPFTSANQQLATSAQNALSEDWVWFPSNPLHAAILHSPSRLPSKTWIGQQLATQLPVARSTKMRPDLCSDQNLRHGRDPYLRSKGRQAWRIFCSLHEERLLPCQMNMMSGAAPDASVIEQIDNLYAYCGWRASKSICLNVRDHYK